jgi:hypothetical protein
MTTTTQTLAAFLLECIAADERAAREASEREWWVDTEGCCVWNEQAGTVAQVSIESSDGTPADARHIAAHDPARVLRQCAALRAVVERCRWMDDDPVVGRDMAVASAQVDDAAAILRALATIYADRPGAEAWL